MIHLHLVYPIVLASTFLLPSASCQGAFKYCCPIAKCNNILNACRSVDILVNGQTCEQTCLRGIARDGQCHRTDLSTLHTEDYSCFEPFLDGLDSQPLKLSCDATYSQNSPATPDLFITYKFCCENCPGWSRSRWNEPTQWAAPLLQYILPAVIFSMTIPRRRRWEVGDYFFNFTLNRLEGLGRALLSLIIAGMVVIVDTVVWVFTISTLAGPMLVGGLYEALIDYRIVKILPLIVGSPSRVHFLSYPERVQLMLVVLCGNLDLGIGDPQRLLNEYIGLPESPFGRLSITQDSFSQNEAGTRSVQLRTGNISEQHWVILERVQVRLRAILTCQYSFGSIVGAPVLFYLGSFFYTVVLLESRKGDNSTAHALAFGMAWMTVPHLAIVSGCLLASNNPSTSTGLVGKAEARGLMDSEELQDERSSNRTAFAVAKSRNTASTNSLPSLRPRKTLPHWAHFGMVPVFDTRFRPVPMWERGQMKTSWLANSKAWQGQERGWLRERVQVGHISWIMLSAASFLLILIPTTMAFLVSYNTPRKGLSCRSLTFVIYTACQLILIVAVAWRGERRYTPTTYTHFFTQWHQGDAGLPTVLGRTLITTIVILAFIGALFTGFAGTLMQILGVYQNCRCAIPVTHWLNPWQEISPINPNSAEAQRSSDMWRTWGYIAIGFMAVVCYGGWWYQRFLRRKFLLQVDELDARRTDKAKPY